MKVHDKISFKLTTVDEKEFLFNSLNKISVISTFPKLNTRICDEQTMHIVQLANKYPQIDFISITNDKTQTIQQWCAAHGLKNVNIYSDKKLQEFAHISKWKLPVLNVFKRGLIVVNNGIITHILLNGDIKKQVNFETLEKILQEV